MGHTAVIDWIHQATRVEYRGLALSADAYSQIRSFTDSNNSFITIDMKLGADAMNSALEKAGVRADIKCISIFGLGCATGTAGFGQRVRFRRKNLFRKGWLPNEETSSGVCQRSRVMCQTHSRINPSDDEDDGD